MINVEDLEFGYRKDRNILKSINIDLEKPELVSILGPNGVGKSTLIHCLNRILNKTKGTVLIKGRALEEYTIKQLAKEVAYVPCATMDTFPLTVLDTVLMGRHPVNGGRLRDDDFEKAYRALDLMEISDLALSMFNELSAGQHQKVALARGLVQEAGILLLDEPTSNLDIKYQLNVTKILKKLTRERGILIIMICHDVNLAAKYSDKIIMMKDGTVFATGTPEEVITEDNILSVYGVQSHIYFNQGRPYIVLNDPELD